MCEKKKTTLYYSRETEALIKEGIKKFSNESPTGTLTITGFIELCIKKAMVTDPEELAREYENSRMLQRALNDLRGKYNFYQSIVLKAHKLMRDKQSLNNIIQEALNME